MRSKDLTVVGVSNVVEVVPKECGQLIYRWVIEGLVLKTWRRRGG